MALDKQRILNELGNVVNQLQSADCGCMGKLFSNSNQGNPNGMASPAPNGCMRGGCCHAQGYGCHGYNAPGAGEPFAGRHCMGSCNPPKLYADTYNYLNHNLMQPVMKEVYDDLRSITPANTVMNSPMAAKMGLAQGNNPNITGGNPGDNMGNMMAQNQMPGEVMGNQNAIPNMNHSPNVRFGNNNMDPNVNNPNAMQMGNQQQFGQPGQPIGQPGQQMGQPMGQPMGGMGAHILNMMKGDASRHANMPNEGGSPQGNLQGNAPQSPGSNVPGGQGQYAAGNMPDNNPSQYNTGNMGMNNMGQGNAVPMQNPTTQYMTQPNMYAGANAQNGQMNPMAANMNQMNPGSQGMRTVSATPANQQMNAHNPYGQHSAGIAKFNEMFPGVMQGDLGFDPMAIAIQMNPANQQKAAMNTMQKMLMSNGEALNRRALMQPVINAANTVAANLAQPNQLASQVSGQNVVAPPIQQQQQLQGENAAAVPVQNNQVPQQQVYTALTGAPTMSQHQVPQQQYQGQYEQQQQQQHQQQQQQQQMVNPNTGASSLPTVYEGSGDPNARQEGYPPTSSAAPTSPGQPMIMDPIFPADTSRNRAPMYMKPQRYYQYNTLGQPIEMIPTRSYPPDLSSQQTLGAQPAPTKYSNVKNTVSKTSLMGNKPVGKTPSRSQLQHIYNQYKGSQSYTQQNIKPSDNGASYSEGHLNVPQGNAPRQVPVEKVGGDTAANNAVNNAVGYKGEPTPPGQVGDVPAGNKPIGDTEKSPINFSKVRNGLQDMTYTSYATSAAWSFHGATPAPFSTGYRYRHKA